MQVFISEKIGDKKKFEKRFISLIQIVVSCISLHIRLFLFFDLLMQIILLLIPTHKVILLNATAKISTKTFNPYT